MPFCWRKQNKKLQRSKLKRKKHVTSVCVYIYIYILSPSRTCDKSWAQTPYNCIQISICNRQTAAQSIWCVKWRVKISFLVWIKPLLRIVDPPILPCMDQADPPSNSASSRSFSSLTSTNFFQAQQGTAPSWWRGAKTPSLRPNGCGGPQKNNVL